MLAEAIAMLQDLEFVLSGLFCGLKSGAKAIQE